jgi:sirohydrochlorin cobaltochelatase
MAKHAVVLAAFGAGGEQGRQALRSFEELARLDFPASSIRWAFTSPLMRRRLNEAGRKTDSVRKALRRLGFDRYAQVTVQPLHLIPGAEYNDLLREIQEAALEGAPPKIDIGAPLLHSAEDMEEAAAALLRHAPAQRRPEEAVIWVGHGAESKGHSAYARLTLAARQKDPALFIGVLYGEPGPEDILPRLRAAGLRKAWLLPLLSVVGKHAREDIDGEHPSSWRGVLEGQGISCMGVLNGAIEYKGLAAIWLRHLREAGGQVTR